ncbi:pyrroloquinoline-quinone synthase PqqC [Mesorhizobium sp. M0830]|uniref:pyrroloquinoline-quinone synthase PqqC n=1 Tax=Mesorhizobium sp. M0830 TaxID=2957008 RepID=UPI0003CEDF26|nr:pyrroloquinoline quinone biosynthesis protein PqqC [Mesorhizobium sp. LNHC252B00]
MTDFSDVVGSGLDAQNLRAVLLQVGHERYHNRHPYHRRMVEGAMSKAELQAWALNRYCYQEAIPRKDAIILSHAEDPAFRAVWRQRIEDHDGKDGRSGGIARWLHLATSLGLLPEEVKNQRLALPATRFAVEAYVNFCASHTLLEAVASSLTELFSPDIIAERVPALLARYDFVTTDALAYFDRRPDQAARDSEFALDYVLRHADTAERQQKVVNSLVFKCDVLWAMLDALDYAYGREGIVPPGCFRPEAIR